jgi:glycosyltransferase involved in cell wall biosynthesis
MSATTAMQQTKQVTIMGPHMERGRAVINAIDALLYLPQSYKLVFAGHPKDQSYYNEIVELVERFELSNRVRFMYEVDEADVVIANGGLGASDAGAVSADSPEALASAILRAVRV